MAPMIDFSARRASDASGEYLGSVAGFGIPCPPSEDLLKSLPAADAKKLMMAYYGAWHACARVSATGTSVSSSGSSVSAGTGRLSGLLKSAVGKVKPVRPVMSPWRNLSAASSVSSLVSGVAQSVEEDFFQKERRIRELSVADGTCYLRAIKLEHLADAFSALSLKPSFSSLITSPAHWFEPKHVLQKLFTVVQQGQVSTVHVNTWGTSGYTTFWSLALSYGVRDRGFSATLRGEPFRKATFVNAACVVGSPEVSLGTVVRDVEMDDKFGVCLDHARVLDGVRVTPSGGDPKWGMCSKRDSVDLNLDGDVLLEAKSVVGEAPVIPVKFDKAKREPYITMGDTASVNVLKSDIAIAFQFPCTLAMVRFEGAVDFGDGVRREGNTTVYLHTGKLIFRPLSNCKVFLSKLQF